MALGPERGIGIHSLLFGGLRRMVAPIMLTMAGAGQVPPRGDGKKEGIQKPGEPKKEKGSTTPVPLDVMHDLEERGFTEDEARRLIDISDHISQSAEFREAEAMMRRLRFTRWLVEHGMLDEWSA